MIYDFKRERHREFPPIVHVENTNICNIKCIHCPQADPYVLVPGYRPQSMPMDIFEQVVAEIAQHPAALRMTPDGETLLPKEFGPMLDSIIAHGVYLFAFNTNGLLLEGDILARLLAPGKTRIAVEVSLDALFKDSYDAIRKGSNYPRVMKNIFTLLAERERLGLSDRVKLLVSAINQPELPPGEFDLFIRFWEGLADKVIRRAYVDTKELMPQKQAPDVQDAEVRKHHDGNTAAERRPCVVPFTRLVVTYDGGVRFCPDDWRKQTTVGRVGEHSLAEIWQGETLQQLREAHRDGRFEHHATCKACTDWRAINWDFDYIAALNDLFGKDVL